MAGPISLPEKSNKRLARNATVNPLIDAIQLLNSYGRFDAAGDEVLPTWLVNYHLISAGAHTGWYNIHIKKDDFVTDADHNLTGDDLGTDSSPTDILWNPLEIAGGGAPLDSDTFGVGLLLGVNSKTKKYVVVALGGGGSGVKAVDLQQVGGADGDDSTEATWTYDMFDANTGDLITPEVAPLFHRFSKGSMTPADHGIAIKIGTVWTLMCCDEEVATDACDSSPQAADAVYQQSVMGGF